MLYANTDEGSSALWVCDEDGVVIDNISYSINERAPILEQINEYYGTSFTGWSDNEIGLQIGASIPNWAAYEKISITYVLIKNNNQTSSAFPGYIEGNVLHMFVVPNTENVYIVSVNDKYVRSSTEYVQPLEEQIWHVVDENIGGISQNQVLIEKAFPWNELIENADLYEVIEPL